MNEREISVRQQKEISPKSESKFLRYQLEVYFRRLIGRSKGIERHAKFPFFIVNDGSQNFVVNPLWVEAVAEENRRICRPHPGALVYNPRFQTFEIAVDETSAVGRIAKLRDYMKEVVNSSESLTNSEDIIKQAERRVRKELLEIFNSYAGIRFNGQRDIYDGRDVSSINRNIIISRPLSAWQAKLTAARRQSIYPELFDRWEEGVELQLKSPTMADFFIYRVLTADQEEEDKELLEARDLFFKAVGLDKARGYIILAEIFYGGDMAKAYKNLSRLFKVINHKFPQSWQCFFGTTTEFRHLAKILSSVEDNVEGYLQAADQWYKGDMQKTFINFSAVASMTGHKFPQSWQCFNGTTTEFKQQLAWLKNNPDATFDTFQNHFQIRNLNTAKLNFAVLKKALAVFN